MEKIEQYHDQVCRCIGGPWSLRQHERQELREHLLDAVAQHRAFLYAVRVHGPSAEPDFQRARERCLDLARVGRRVC